MNSIEYGQTLATVEEMMRDERHVSKLMDVQRTKIVQLSKDPDDYDVYDYCAEILVAGNVEYNCETDGYWVLGMYAKRQGRRRNRPDGSERQRQRTCLFRLILKRCGDETDCSSIRKPDQSFGPALKTSTNPHFKSRYADLAACVEAVIEGLNYAFRQESCHAKLPRIGLRRDCRDCICA